MSSCASGVGQTSTTGSHLAAVVRTAREEWDLRSHSSRDADLDREHNRLIQVDIDGDPCRRGIHQSATGSAGPAELCSGVQYKHTRRTIDR